MRMAGPGKSQFVVPGGPWAGQMKKPKLPQKPKTDLSQLGARGPALEQPSDNRTRETDISNRGLTSSGGAGVSGSVGDTNKLGVSNLRNKFESPTTSPGTSPLMGPRRFGCGDQTSLGSKVNSVNIKPSTVLEKSPIRSGTERHCVPPPSQNIFAPVTDTSKCPNPAPCKPSNYVNRYVQQTPTSSVPPPLLPRKTQKQTSTTPPVTPKDISTEDQRCLLKKVPAPRPAPTPRVSKMPTGAAPSDRSGVLLLQSQSNQDGNNNKPESSMENNNRDSTGSAKSQDSGVGSSSPLDDGYFELNDDQSKQNKQSLENGGSSPARSPAKDVKISKQGASSLKVQIPVSTLGSRDSNESVDADGYERVNKLDFSNQTKALPDPSCTPLNEPSFLFPISPVNGSAPVAPAPMPPLPEKTRRKSYVDGILIKTVIPEEPLPTLPEKRKPNDANKELKHSVPVPIPKQHPENNPSDLPSSPSMSHSRSEPSLNSGRLRNARKPTLDVPYEFRDVGAPPLPPRSPTAKRRDWIPDLSPSAAGRSQGLDHMDPDTVVPPPTHSPSQHEKSPDKTPGSKKSNRLAMEVPAPSPNTTKAKGVNLSDDVPTAPPPPPPCGLRLDKSVRAVGSYIGPEELDSVPDTTPQAVFRAPIPRPGAHTSYLQLADDDDDVFGMASSPVAENEDYYSFVDAEPLYQVYHRDVVAREIVHQASDVTSDTPAYNDDDEDYMYMDADSVKLHLADILSRDSVAVSDYDVVPDYRQSSLQDVVKLGAGTRKLWCEMPQVKDSTVLESLSVEDKKLQEALFEVITSEASYVKSINLLVSHFLNAPELEPENLRFSVITKRHHHTLFSNIRQVQKVCQVFLQKLEHLWHVDYVLNATDIAETIAQYATKHFKAYVVYVSNMMFQERTLKELNTNNSDFMRLVESLERAECVQGLSLQSFLVLPMQRITRLPLLVDSICHRMQPNESGHEDLTNALHVLQKIVRQCNEGARQLANIEQVTEIDRMLEFKNVKSIALVSQHRSVVKQGQLTRILSQSSGLFSKKKMVLHLFLFNDMLVVTKKKSSNVYQVIEHAPRIAIHADLLSDDDIVKWLPKGVPNGCPHLFIMALMEKDVKFLLSCDSMSERTRWVEAVTPAQQVNEDEKIYDDWDCPQIQCIQRYQAQQPDELSLEESDIVNVHRKMADGWFQGERIRDGEKGWFPSSVTMEIQSAHVRAKNLRQHYRLMHGLSASSSVRVQ